MKKIVFTGGTGRFAKIFKKIKHNYKIKYPSKKELNIESLNSVTKYLSKNKPNYLIHCAGLSRPMEIHEKKISKSISINIIGTSNIVRACSKKNIKLIYFSTNYVYPGIKGNYSESDPVLPINNYAISKLGGECAVQMYKNSLIVRACMTEKPFIHRYAYKNVYTNFIYHEEFVKLFLKIIDKKGVFNLGGNKNSIYNFAKKENKLIKTKLSRGEFPKRLDMNLNKFKSL